MDFIANRHNKLIVVNFYSWDNCERHKLIEKAVSLAIMEESLNQCHQFI